jgi:hypothetical protein
MRSLGNRLGSAASRFGRALARRERLWAGIALAGIGLVFAGFVAIHLLVSGRQLRAWVNTSPEELLLDYDSASSWVPGQLHVRGLTLRGSDENVQWFFRIEDATISISLLDLLARRFHATSVQARGLVFHLREKEEAGEVSSAHAERLPKIPGFSDPPRVSGGNAPPSGPESAGGRFWSVWVENLVADPVSDLWIEIYRFRGRGRITGGFFLHPHREARVGPARVQFLAGDIALAPGQPLLSSASGSADCTIASYDPESVHGGEVWQRISGTIRLEGRLSDIRFLNHFLRRSPEPRLEGEGGKAHGELRVTGGIGTGSAAFETPLVARYARGALAGQASGWLAIPRWDFAHDDLEISGSRLELADVATAGTPRDEREWWGRFEIAAGRLAWGLAARVSAQCRDARPLYTALGADLPAWAQRVLKLDDVRATARIRLRRDFLDVEDLEGTGGRFRFRGRYREERSDRSGAFLLETGPLAVGVSIQGPSSRVKLIGARKWFEETARATGGGARAHTLPSTAAPQALLGSTTTAVPYARTSATP